MATRGREGNGDDGEARRATRRRPSQRRAPALVFIIVGGVAAVAVTFVLARRTGGVWAGPSTSSE